MFENYIGMEKVRTTIQNLQESSDKRFDEFEGKLEKKPDILKIAMKGLEVSVILLEKL